MAKSQRGVRVAQGLVASAEARRCPECGRGAALVEVVEPDRRGEICRWTRENLCTYPGVFITRGG